MIFRYRLIRFLFSLGMQVFFRRVAAVGLKNVPSHGGALIIANHTNSLVDVILIMVTLKRRVRPVAKAALKKSPYMRVILWLLGAELVHRADDGKNSAQSKANSETLERLAGRLVEGEIVVIFPEGKSHSEPAMLPFKSGAARIALAAWERDRNIAVIPSALIYTEKSHRRSEALVKYLEPIRAVSAPQQPKDLTGYFEERISNEVPQFTSEEERAISRWVTDLFSAEEYCAATLGTDYIKARSFSDLMLRCSKALNKYSAEEKRSLISPILKHKQKIEQSGFDINEGFLAVSKSKAVVFLIRELEVLIFGGILGIAGFILNIVPLKLTRLAVKVSSKDEDHFATHAVFIGLPIFILWITALGVALVLTVGTLFTGVGLLVYIYLSAVCLCFFDRVGAAAARARAFLSICVNRNRFDNFRSAVEELRLELRMLEEQMCHR